MLIQDVLVTFVSFVNNSQRVILEIDILKHNALQRRLSHSGVHEQHENRRIACADGFVRFVAHGFHDCFEILCLKTNTMLIDTFKVMILRLRDSAHIIVRSKSMCYHEVKE